MGWIKREPYVKPHICGRPDPNVAGVGSTWKCSQRDCGKLWVIVGGDYGQYWAEVPQ